MKNFKIAISLFLVIFCLSLIAYADRGPCKGGGSEPINESTESPDGHSMVVVTGTVYFDQNCANQNENLCEETYVSTATRKDGTLIRYARLRNVDTGEWTAWKQVGVPEPVLEKGKKVC